MLTENDVEAELSYAYLHAVASRAGFGCVWSNRALDNAGVDARVDTDGEKLADDSYFTAITLDVQLKATRQEPVERGGRYSLSLPIAQYDKLRSTRTSNQRLLVVLYLPHDKERWLSHSEEALTARRCAYWASLRGAPVSGNSTEQTVYIPRSQPLTPDSLRMIMTILSREDRIGHVT
jgi:hypothetical protein